MSKFEKIHANIWLISIQIFDLEVHRGCSHGPLPCPFFHRHFFFTTLFKSLHLIHYPSAIYPHFLPQIVQYL